MVKSSPTASLPKEGFDKYVSFINALFKQFEQLLTPRILSATFENPFKADVEEIIQFVNGFLKIKIADKDDILEKALVRILYFHKAQECTQAAESLCIQFEDEDKVNACWGLVNIKGALEKLSLSSIPLICEFYVLARTNRKIFSQNVSKIINIINNLLVPLTEEIVEMEKIKAAKKGISYLRNFLFDAFLDFSTNSCPIQRTCSFYALEHFISLCEKRVLSNATGKPLLEESDSRQSGISRETAGASSLSLKVNADPLPVMPFVFDEEILKDFPELRDSENNLSMEFSLHFDPEGKSSVIQAILELVRDVQNCLRIAKENSDLLVKNWALQATQELVDIYKQKFPTDFKKLDEFISIILKPIENFRSSILCIPPEFPYPLKKHLANLADVFKLLDEKTGLDAKRETEVLIEAIQPLWQQGGPTSVEIESAKTAIASYETALLKLSGEEKIMIAVSVFASFVLGCLGGFIGGAACARSIFAGAIGSAIGSVGGAIAGGFFAYRACLLQHTPLKQVSNVIKTPQVRTESLSKSC